MEKPPRHTICSFQYLPGRNHQDTRDILINFCQRNQDTRDVFTNICQGETIETHEMFSPVSARENHGDTQDFLTVSVMISPRHEMISTRQKRCSHRFVPERNHQDTQDDLTKTHEINSPISAREKPSRHLRFSHQDTWDDLTNTHEINSPISAREKDDVTETHKMFSLMFAREKPSRHTRCSHQDTRDDLNETHKMFSSRHRKYSHRFLPENHLPPGSGNSGTRSGCLRWRMCRRDQRRAGSWDDG